MLEFEQLKQELSLFLNDLAKLKENLHIDKILEEKTELELRTTEPDFWQNQDKAKEIQSRLGNLQKKIENFNSLNLKTEELATIIDLGLEFSDETLLKEATTLFKLIKDDFEKLRLETLFKGEYDRNNAILTLHSGAGGTEAQDWVEMLYRMYTRFAEKHGFSLKLLDLQDGDEAGLKSVSFLVQGDNAYGFLKGEMGVHRLVRISPFDSSGRRHTSFASLEVMPEIEEAIAIEIRSEDLKVDTFRSSGAGGQHVNKTESAIRITHIPTGLVVSCQTERSQIQNRETALNMLKSKLYALAKEAHMDKIEDLKGQTLEIAWGSQIRSYIFCPYTLVKDHRTSAEKVDVDKVMDGDLDIFIQAYLTAKNEKQVGL